MSDAIASMRQPRKRRASFALMPIDRALTMDFSGLTYVYAHPAFWAVKGISPDCIMGVGPIGEEMAGAFAEYGCFELPLCVKFDYDAFARRQRVAQKAREAVASGVIELFG